MAHALLIQVQLDPDADVEHRHGILRDVVVPETRALPGFQKGTWMHDGQGLGTCVAVFDTERHARAALTALTPAAGPPVMSAGVHEVDVEV